jgi:asparagine synthase (glutamine-hydrolysing)
MASGVEVRIPRLDKELGDYVANLPINYKQNDATGKWILKKAMEPYLPHDVIYRTKTGFGFPMRQWLYTRLRLRVEDFLSPASILNYGVFDPKAVQALIERDRVGATDGSYTVFPLLCMEMWCRQFIDGDYTLAVTQSVG